MEAMAEANADAKEIDEAVRIGGDVAIGVPDFDDAELEEELHRLAIESVEEKQDESRETKLGSLPAAPLHDVWETSRTNPEREAVAS